MTTFRLPSGGDDDACPFGEEDPFMVRELAPAG